MQAQKRIHMLTLHANTHRCSHATHSGHTVQVWPRDVTNRNAVPLMRYKMSYVKIGTAMNASLRNTNEDILLHTRRGGFRISRVGGQITVFSSGGE